MAQITHYKKLRVGLLKQTSWDSGLGTVSSAFLNTNWEPTAPNLNYLNESKEIMSGVSTTMDSGRAYNDLISAPKTLPFSCNLHTSQIKHLLAALTQYQTETQKSETVNTTAASATVNVIDGTLYAPGQTISITSETFGSASSTTIASTGSTSITLSVACDNGVSDKDLTVSEFVVQAYPPDVDDIPTFASAGDGYLYTLAWEGTNDGSSHGDGILMYNSILNNMNINIEVDAQGMARLAKATGEWISSDVATGQRFTGTWTSLNDITPAQYGFPAGSTNKWAFYLAAGATTYDGTLKIKNFELNYNNNVRAVGGEAGGKTGTWLLSPEITGVIRVYHSQTSSGSNKLMDLLTDGSAFTWNLRTPTNSLGIVNGSMRIGCTSNTNGTPTITRDGDYMVLEIPFTVQRPSAGWGSGLFKTANLTETFG